MRAQEPNIEPEGDICSLQERLSNLSKLLDVARQLSHERDLDELLNLIARAVVQVIRAESCSIFLLDEDRDEIWSRILLSRDVDIRFPRNEGIAGHTIRTGEALIIDDPYRDPRFNPAPDQESGYRTRNLICVPLRTLEGRVLGCFEVVNKVEGTFDDSDLEYLDAFASQAAVALEAAQFHEERQRHVQQLELVCRLERALNESRDFDRFMESVVREATHCVGAIGGAILVSDPDSGGHLFTYLKGEEPDPMGPLDVVSQDSPFSPESAVLRRDLEAVASTGEPQFVGTVSGTGRSFTAIFPLARVSAEEDGGRLTGALKVVFEQGTGMRRQDQRLLEILSEQITSAILRKRLLEERARGDRLATVGTLASSIIHDFKSPMTVILGYTDLILHTDPPRERKEKFCRTITAEVERCVNMCQEVLDYSRGEQEYAFESVDTESFFREIRFVLDQEMARLGITFLIDVEAAAPMWVDPDKIKRVIYNLSSNALGVLGEGDRFSITGTSRPDGVRLTIADSGPGIPADIRDRLFEPFVTHGKKKGTGLGLCIAREILMAHGGSIRLDDTSDGGATFHIELATKGRSRESGSGSRESRVEV